MTHLKCWALFSLRNNNNDNSSLLNIIYGWVEGGVQIKSNKKKKTGLQNLPGECWLLNIFISGTEDKNKTKHTSKRWKRRWCFHYPTTSYCKEKPKRCCQCWSIQGRGCCSICQKGLCQNVFEIHTVMFLIWLTHCSQETRKRVIGKQWRPRSDAAECGICSGSPLFANSLAIFL